MFDSVEKIDGKIVYWLTKDPNDEVNMRVGIIMDTPHENCVTGEIATGFALSYSAFGRAVKRLEEKAKAKGEVEIKKEN